MFINFLTIQKIMVKQQEPEEVEWIYQCQKCGAVIRSKEHKKIPIPPTACHEDQGGCGRNSKMKDITNEYLHRELRKLREK